MFDLDHLSTKWLKKLKNPTKTHQKVERDRWHQFGSSRWSPLWFLSKFWSPLRFGQIPDTFYFLYKWRFSSIFLLVTGSNLPLFEKVSRTCLLIANRRPFWMNYQEEQPLFSSWAESSSGYHFDWECRRLQKQRKKVSFNWTYQGVSI